MLASFRRVHNSEHNQSARSRNHSHSAGYVPPRATTAHSAPQFKDVQPSAHEREDQFLQEDEEPAMVPSGSMAQTHRPVRRPVATPKAETKIQRTR